MRLWPGVLMVLLLIALPIIWACAPQSNMSAVEVIHEVKEWEQAIGFYIPLASHWAAVYEGQGVWVVAMICFADEENYPAEWFQQHPLEASEYSYFAYNTPYIWRYYERSGDVEHLGANESIEVLEQYPELYEAIAP
jgi:hypothetical protein